LVVAVVAAYLVGSAVMSLRDVAVRAAAAAMIPKVTSEAYLTADRKKSLVQSVFAPFSRPSLRRIHRLEAVQGDSDLTHRVCHDVIFGGGKRLLVAHSQAYDEYQRLKSEASFRDAVVVPGLALVMVGTLHTNVDAWLDTSAGGLAFCIGVVLTHQARALDREANSMHLHLVADGVVSTQTLDERETK
jgi:hypothetical protein